MRGKRPRYYLQNFHIFLERGSPGTEDWATPGSVDLRASGQPFSQRGLSEWPVRSRHWAPPALQRERYWLKVLQPLCPALRLHNLPLAMPLPSLIWRTAFRMEEGPQN